MDNMNDVLVTGGNGLVGSAIDGGIKPSSKELNLMNYNDIVNFIKKNKIKKIIHCAAKVGGIKANMDFLADFYYENVIMNTHLLHAAKETGVAKVVSVMSTCIFPDDAVYPLKIEHIHDGEPPQSHYAYSYAKRMLEVQSRAYRDQYGCNFVNVVPCNVYGPKDNYNLNDSHVIPALIHKFYLAKNNKTQMEVWGDGSPQREFIFSKDLAFILVEVLKNYDNKKPLVISPDEFVSIKNVVDKLAQIYNFNGDIIYQGQKMNGQIKKPSDNTEMKKFLSTYCPDFNFTNFEDGIMESVNWFINNYETVRK
jgi:GDP-L-fucose synthase